MSLDSIYRKLNYFYEKFAMFEKINPQTNKKEDLKEKVKDNAGDLFNELHFIYKERYSEEKKIGYKKLGLADDYDYESEEEGKKQRGKKPDKIEPLKKSTKLDAK